MVSPGDGDQAGRQVGQRRSRGLSWGRGRGGQAGGSEKEPWSLLGTGTRRAGRWVREGAVVSPGDGDQAGRQVGQRRSRGLSWGRGPGGQAGGSEKEPWSLLGTGTRRAGRWVREGAVVSPGDGDQAGRQVGQRRSRGLSWGRGPGGQAGGSEKEPWSLLGTATRRAGRWVREGAVVSPGDGDQAGRQVGQKRSRGLSWGRGPGGQAGGSEKEPWSLLGTGTRRAGRWVREGAVVSPGDGDQAGRQVGQRRSRGLSTSLPRADTENL